MLVYIPNTSCILKAFALDKGCYLLLYFQFQRSAAFVVAGSGSEPDALDEQSLVCSAFCCQRALTSSYLSCSTITFPVSGIMPKEFLD